MPVTSLMSRAFLFFLGSLSKNPSTSDRLISRSACASNKTVLKLHRDTVDLVKAPSQAMFADKLIPHLTDEEYGYYRRGKNAHTHATPKSATKQEYAKATGLEALFGALYLLGRTDRLNALFDMIVTEEEENGI